MRFIHTADWHLGRIFYGRHLTAEQEYILRQLEQLIGECKAEALVIAGDVYDRSVPPTEAVELLDETLARILLERKIPVIMIAGNHDSPQRLAFGSQLLARQGLYVAGSPRRPVVLKDAFGEVYFAPLPYAEPAWAREWSGDAALEGHEQALEWLAQAALARIPDGARKVAVAHAFVAGSKECESERPLSVGGGGMVAPAVFAPFHYTALGHLHGAQRAGGDAIRYAGSLLKYSFDEAAQSKGVQIVDLDAAGAVRAETVRLTPRRDVRVLTGYFDEILRAGASDPAPEDYLQVILKDDAPILDVKGRLARVYPNVMQVERPFLHVGDHLAQPRSDHRRLTEVELFGSFYAQMTGGDWTQEQRDAFVSALDELRLLQREGKA